MSDEPENTPPGVGVSEPAVAGEAPAAPISTEPSVEVSPSQETPVNAPSEPAPLPVESVPVADTTASREVAAPQSVPATSTPAVSAPVVAPPNAQDDFAAKRPGMFARFLEVITGRKRKRLEKIVALAQARGQTTDNTITNDDVEKLLRVSHATAYRYLRELVERGKLRKIGHPRVARYELVR
jgi:hypothetical protein